MTESDTPSNSLNPWDTPSKKTLQANLWLSYTTATRYAFSLTKGGSPAKESKMAEALTNSLSNYNHQKEKLMMTTIYTAKTHEDNPVPVSIEVTVSSGIGIHIIGLSDKGMKESLLRTITALLSSGYSIPGKKIVINITPADLEKNGEDYDIPIAIGLIAASGQKELPFLKDYVLTGRLGLDGSIYEANDPEAAVKVAAAQNMKGCILPLHSALQIKDKQGIDVWGLSNLNEVLKLLEEGETF